MPKQPSIDTILDEALRTTGNCVSMTSRIERTLAAEQFTTAVDMIKRHHAGEWPRISARALFRSFNKNFCVDFSISTWRDFYYRTTGGPNGKA